MKHYDLLPVAGIVKLTVLEVSGHLIEHGRVHIRMNCPVRAGVIAGSD
jgi:hypothetical protein